MKIVFLDAQTVSEKWIHLAEELYLEKINPLLKIESQSVFTKKTAREDAHRKKDSDSEALLKTLSADDFVVLFDEKGDVMDSKKFAKQFESILSRGKKRVVFIIGGAFGVNGELLQRANLKINLSPMTLNHAVAKIVALEQIYRSLTILKNLPYHN